MDMTHWWIVLNIQHSGLISDRRNPTPVGRAESKLWICWSERKRPLLPCYRGCATGSRHLSSYSRLMPRSGTLPEPPPSPSRSTLSWRVWVALGFSRSLSTLLSVGTQVFGVEMGGLSLSLTAVIVGRKSNAQVHNRSLRSGDLKRQKLMTFSFSSEFRTN